MKKEKEKKVKRITRLHFPRRKFSSQLIFLQHFFPPFCCRFNCHYQRSLFLKIVQTIPSFLRLFLSSVLQSQKIGSTDRHFFEIKNPTNAKTKENKSENIFHKSRKRHSIQEGKKINCTICSCCIYYMEYNVTN